MGVTIILQFCQSNGKLPLPQLKQVNCTVVLIYASRVKVTDILGLSVLKNKTVCPTYLRNYKDYLIVADVEIEGGHDLPLDSNSLLGHLHHVITPLQ